MRNRAKCKLCNITIESLGPTDYVSCTCGEITIGPDLFCKVTNWNNFLRVDDNEHEIEVTYQEKHKEENREVNKKEDLHVPTKDELLGILNDMIKSYENLPQHALLAPVSHADQLSLLMVVSSLFNST